jgi:D-alanyl-lipoteichoic acid acyltransferase DltB (MBOAT superfamily)
MNINLMLTMLIGGLWHGTSWKFVIWGGLNGLGIIFLNIGEMCLHGREYEGYLAVFGQTLTFCFITFTHFS